MLTSKSTSLRHHHRPHPPLHLPGQRQGQSMQTHRLRPAQRPQSPRAPAIPTRLSNLRTATHLRPSPSPSYHYFFGAQYISPPRKRKGYTIIQQPQRNNGRLPNLFHGIRSPHGRNHLLQSGLRQQHPQGLLRPMGSRPTFLLGSQVRILPHAVAERRWRLRDPGERGKERGGGVCEHWGGVGLE